MKRNRVLIAAAAAACLIAGITALLAWPSAPSSPAAAGAARSRQYADVRACMLTGASGVSGPLAAAAWAGLQGASNSTRAMISYLPVPDPATPASARPYVASLVQRQCGVILAVGQAQAAAARSAATSFSQVHFIVVTAGPAGPPVVRIPAGPAGTVRTAVQAAVIAALHD